MAAELDRLPAEEASEFQVALAPPPLAEISGGNAGIPGVWTFAAPQPGPHTCLVSLIHGNEYAGAIALAELRRLAGLPARGRLSLVFANLEAFARFDPRAPTASRYVDEDLNRLWCRAVLDGPRDSAELRRARTLRPLFDTVDVLVDLHSMLWDGDPLILCGATEKARRLALAIGAPPLVVGDQGHLGGRRLIDYRPFADPGSPRAAVLVEAGQHWQAATVRTMRRAIAGVLRHTAQLSEAAAGFAPALAAETPVVAEVTMTVTAESNDFRFVRPFRGGEVVPDRNTLIALDGDAEIRTPHDDCILVMPSLRPSRGHTAVRLARRVG